jgi:hypothetical protein
VVAVVPTGSSAPTFDLTVEDEHEFFANGVLVHNSSDTLIYARKLVARMYEAGLVVRESDSRAPMSYADPMGLGGDDDELGAGADDAFDSWMHGQADDWGV